MVARLCLLACFYTGLSLAEPTFLSSQAHSYSIAGQITASGGMWDYAVIDPSSRRLYLAQGGVTAVDLKTNAIVPKLVSSTITHGLAVIGDGIIAVDDSQKKTISLFHGIDGAIVSVIQTAKYNPASGRHALDALVFEPKTGLLIAINGESGLILLVDVKKSSVTGTMSVSGHPEFAAADGAGKIYINVNHPKSSEIEVLDISKRRSVKRIPLDGCETATGLAYDLAQELVMSVCDNGFLKVFDAPSGRPVANIVVGRGADAVMFDSKRQLAFIASGDDATLSVIAVRSTRDIALVQTLTTQTGTRLGAVDTASGVLYLPSAEFAPPIPPMPYPSVVAGTFKFLIVAAK